MKDINFDLYTLKPSTEFTNTATVNAGGYHSSDEATFKVYNYADLSVTKTLSTPTGCMRESLIYIIKVVNNGPSMATEVILTEVLSPNSTYRSIYLTQGTYKCSNGKITCYLGDLNCDANAIAIITIAPKCPGILSTNTFVSANECDDNCDNNFITTSTKICCLYPAACQSLSFICMILILTTIQNIFYS